MLILEGGMDTKVSFYGFKYFRIFSEFRKSLSFK